MFNILLGLERFRGNVGKIISGSARRIVRIDALILLRFFGFRQIGAMVLPLP
jgi:hypothetical protein